MINIADAGKLRITELDAIRLEQMIYAAQQTKKDFSLWHNRLRTILDMAEVVSSDKIEPFRITMNSRVKIQDVNSQEQINIALVFPIQKYVNYDEATNVSVLSPLGMSVLGRQIGEVIGGRIKLSKLLYQPEATGDYAI